MAVIGIGYIIKKTRKQRKYQAKKLAYGLCTPSKLSKIENGEILPDHKLLEALMQRLDLPSNFIYPVNEREFKRLKLETEINAAISHYKKDFLELIEEYKDCETKMTNLENQFYLYAMGCYYERKKEREIGLDYFFQAIKLTIPEFNIDDDLEQYLLSPFELLLINCIACCIARLKSRSKCIKLLESINHYFIKYIFCEKDFNEFFCTINLNLANKLSGNGQYKESLYYANEGIKLAIQSKRKFILADLVYIKGFNLYSLGNTDDGIKTLAKSIKLYKIFGQPEDIQESFEDIKNCLGENVLTTLQKHLSML